MCDRGDLYNFTESTAEIIGKIQQITYPAIQGTYAVSGLVNAYENNHTADVVLNSLPYVCIIQSSFNLTYSLVQLLKGMMFRDKHQMAVSIYLGFFDALLWEGAYETIKQTGDTLDLSTLFFRLAINCFGHMFFQLYELSSGWHNKQTQIALAVISLSSLAMGSGYLALSYADDRGWGLIALAAAVNFGLGTVPTIYSFFKGCQSNKGSNSEHEVVQEPSPLP